MNVTELARRLKVNTKDLLDYLPQMGFDIGARAIKVDDRTAMKIIRYFPDFFRRIEIERLAERKKKEIEARKMKMESEGPILLPSVITVKDFAERLGLPLNQVIKELMNNSILATINEKIDFDTASIIAEDMGFQVSREGEGQEHEGVVSHEEKLKRIIGEQTDGDLKPRPPVVVVMGHVDHGKTKLLDAIRETNVVDTEHGGITQHIGAYQVEKNSRKITFIDTPGHEAFTAMRSRGAKVADIAILVVAADDGIKPQTIEAIKIIQAIGIPFIVAINKIDKPEANVEKVKQDLAQQNLLPEDWGGKVICVPISAKQKLNIDKLLETLLLVADMEAEKIVANPDRLAVGTVIEAHVDKNEGLVATILVQSGTLHANDDFGIDGTFYCRVRAMKDWRGEAVDSVAPGTPIKILGWKLLPRVGDIFEVVSDCKCLEKKAKRPAASSGAVKAVVADVNNNEEKIIKNLNIILKTDVLGSSEAIIESLAKIEKPVEIGYKIIKKGLGNINESDVMQAEGDSAVVIGFNVFLSPIAESMAREKKVAVRTFKIIYELLDFVKSKFNEMIEIEIKEIDLGQVELLAVYNRQKNCAIVGGRVKSGKIENGCKVRVRRDDSELGRGVVNELQSGKQSVRDVMAGQECGIKVDTKIDLAVGDVLEAYTEEQIKKVVK